MLDAPVSGGPKGAASRKLAIWVGGEKAAFDSTRPCSTRSATRPRYIGPIGAATVAKLVHNMSGYAIVCALAETFAMGVKAGVEPLALWEAVRQGAAGRRYTFDALIDQWLPGKYDPPRRSRSSSRTRTLDSRPRWAASSACRCASASWPMPR